MSSLEKKDSSRIASSEFNSYANSSITLFHISTILLLYDDYIIILLLSYYYIRITLLL